MLKKKKKPKKRIGKTRFNKLKNNLIVKSEVKEAIQIVVIRRHHYKELY